MGTRRGLWWAAAERTLCHTLPQSHNLGTATLTLVLVGVECRDERWLIAWLSTFSKHGHPQWRERVGCVSKTTHQKAGEWGSGQETCTPPTCPGTETREGDGVQGGGDANDTHLLPHKVGWTRA